jgi:arsenite methyltransferase
MKLEVFDPPMCCSTGVCGPGVDPALVNFTADLDWLKRQGISIERYNLSQQTQSFIDNALVSNALKEFGNDCLPLILIDNKIVSKGAYPNRNKLAELAGLKAPDKGLTFTVYQPQSGSSGCCDKPDN